MNALVGTLARIRRALRGWCNTLSGGTGESSVLLILVIPATMILFDPIQLGIEEVARVNVDQAVYWGARQAMIDGGESANVDTAVTKQLSSAHLHATNGDGTVSWNVYANSNCTLPVAAGTVAWATPLYFCLTYNYPRNVIFLGSGTDVWQRSVFIRAQQGN